MTDMEHWIIEQLRSELSTAYPSCDIGSDIQLFPARFPYVFFIQSDNADRADMRTAAYSGTYSTRLFTVEVYTNRRDSRKEQASEIMDIITRTLQRMNFQKIDEKPLPYEPGYYRLTARFRASIKETFGLTAQSGDKYVIFQK